MINFIKNSLKHLKVIIIHKYYVGIECFKVGLYWQGIVHDLSKFHPVEFIESAKYFTGDRSPIDNAKDVNGFSNAWNHHKGINKHHWQYWIDQIDGKCVPCKIPDKYLLEACCDIVAASKTYLKNEYHPTKAFNYFKSNKWIMLEKDKDFMEKKIKKYS